MIAKLLEKSVAGERLTPEEGLQLLQSHDLASLGAAANAVTQRLHPEDYRTYNVDRNINYTNICTAVCHFCAFYRPPGHEEGYVLPREELLQKVRETAQRGGDQILLQGGLHPKYRLEWYEEMLHDIHECEPSINVHGFSPPELFHFTKVNNLDLETVLSRLRDAGLGSLPGGGAEILGGSCPIRIDARQGDDRRLVGRQPRLAPTWWAQQRDDDVRTRRDLSGTH